MLPPIPRPKWLDFGLIVVLTGIGIYWTVRLFSAPPGSRVVVWIDGHRSAWYALTGPVQRDTVTGYQGPVVLEYGNGTAHIVSAPCAGHICIRQGQIRHQGERLICVPSRIVVSVENSNQEAEFDAIP
jgi:hypothetical protein